MALSSGVENECIGMAELTKRGVECLESFKEQKKIRLREKKVIGRDVKGLNELGET